MSDKTACRVVLPVRLSYAFIAEPRPDDEKKDANGDPLYYYSTQIIIPKSDKATVQKLNKAVQGAIAKKFGKDKVKAAWNNPNFKKPLRDADAEGREGVEYEGTVFANAKTNAKGATDYGSRPGIVLKNRTKLTDVGEINSEVYSGCYVMVSVTAYYFKNSGSQGIALALNNIMKDKEGERLDGSMNAEDEFADMFEEDEFSETNTDDFDMGGFDDDLDDDLGL